MRRPRWPFLAVGLGCLLLAGFIELAHAQTSGNGHVVVVGQDIRGEFVNLTVTTYTSSGMIRSAGLFLNDSLVSNEVGGVWLTYDSRHVLPFRLHALTQRVELRVVYETSRDTNSTTSSQRIPLSLQDAANVRPIRTQLDGDRLTITLQNLGKGTSPAMLASLEDDGRAIIADPYYVHLDPIPARASVNLSFDLNSSPDRAFLVLESSGHRNVQTVYLSGAGSGSMKLSTDYPSLQGAPGGTVQFSLKLTNSGGERLVRLETVDLPESFSPTITVQGSSVQTVRVPAGATRDVAVSLRMPATSNETAAPTVFQLAVEDAATGSRITAIDLTVSPNGAARLELTGRNWNAILRDGVAKATLSVRNTGTAAAHGVTLTVSPPPGWDVQVTPSSVARIEPGATADLEVQVRAPSGTGEGRYVVDVVAQAGSLVTRERSLSVEVEDPPSSRLPWLIGATLVGLGSIALVIRIRRR